MRLIVAVNPSCFGGRFLRLTFSHHLLLLFVCLFSLLARTNQCRNRREFSSQTPRRRGIISFWLSLFAGFFISTVFYLWSEDETVCEWLYFRTTEDNLRKAFEQFGKLTLGRKTSGYMNDIQEFEHVVRPPMMESDYPFLEIEEVVAGPFLEDLSRFVVPPKKPSIAEEPATSLSPFSTARVSHNTDNSSSLTILLMFRK
ncbi:hypothetical protein HID58_078867 [Brassica napus]|uniref:Uncharacterized protein n=1 Tax=Brassica napus TaxID=3708 RepID=A0ABQ7YVA8_BRANA|nr:hypothetical protein HID58_078867 [Brassica napus]